MSQERRHGGDKPGKASVNGSPDHGGSHSLIGVIDTPRLLWYFSVQSKRAFKIPIPSCEVNLNQTNPPIVSLRVY